MKVDCVYRLAEDGEVIHSWFDLETGRISYQDIFNRAALRQIKGFEFLESDYRGSLALNSSFLYDRMYSGRRDTLLAINWCNVGCLEVRNDSASVYLPKSGKTAKYNDLDEPLLEVEVFSVGIRRASVQTLSTSQALTYAYGYMKYGRVFIQTELGEYPVFGGDIIPFNKSEKKRYKELVYSEDSPYCTCMTDNGVEFLYLEQHNDMFVLKEKEGGN